MAGNCGSSRAPAPFAIKAAGGHMRYVARKKGLTPRERA